MDRAWGFLTGKTILLMGFLLERKERDEEKKAEIGSETAEQRSEVF